MTRMVMTDRCEFCNRLDKVTTETRQEVMNTVLIADADSFTVKQLHNLADHANYATAGIIVGKGYIKAFDATHNEDHSGTITFDDRTLDELLSK